MIILTIIIFIASVAIIFFFVFNFFNKKHVPPRFLILEEEIIICEIDAVWIKSKFKSRLGRLYLTNFRLVMSKQNRFIYLFGIIGFLIAKFFTSKKPIINIQVRNLQTIQRTKYGLNKSILDIVDNTNTVYRLSFSKKYMDTWLTALSKYATILPQNF